MKANAGLDYVRRFRKKVWPWMNQCVSCQHLGYKPELSERIYPGVFAQMIRKYFKPLPLSEIGLCELCAEHAAQKAQKSEPGRGS